MDYQEALDKFTETKSYWANIYEAHRVSTRFSIGLDQWTDRELRLRGGIANCLSVPVLPQYIHQVVNDMKMNTPSINVLPGEGGGDKETAKILKGLIRNIEYKSKSDSVYDTAGDYAVRGGFGFIGVDHDYISDESFLQELKLRRFQNPQSVYIDMNSVDTQSYIDMSTLITLVNNEQNKIFRDLTSTNMYEADTVADQTVYSLPSYFSFDLIKAIVSQDSQVLTKPPHISQLHILFLIL
jgi:hypothetical protein